MLDGLWDVLFPPACAGCGALLERAAAFCDTCDLSLSPLPAPRCQVCAEPGELPTGRCARCTRRPPPFTEAFAPFGHEGALARAIHRFKYEDHPELAPVLASLLAQGAAVFLARHPGPLLAIPLHPKRLRERKFDQARLLARALGHTLRRPVLTDGLERARPTARQVGLSEAEREDNLAGAFVARAEPVRGQDVLLVDDVFTTGATARAAAQALLDAGARSVSVLAVARAYSD